MEEWHVNARPTYFRRRIYIYLIALPVMIYASLIAMHNLFGIDLSGGWLGEPRSASSGQQGAVLMGLPTYFFFFGKTILQYCRGNPRRYFLIDDTCVRIIEPLKRSIPWSKIEEIRFWNDYGVHKLRIRGKFRRNVSIKIQHLDTDRDELVRRFEAIAHDKKIEFTLEAENRKRGFFDS